LQIYII